MSNKKLKLYKYVSLSIAESIVVSSTLRFTNPSNFNDPFDCNISRLKFEITEKIDPYAVNEIQVIKSNLKGKQGITDEMIASISNGLLERGYKEMQMKKNQKSSICCFSLLANSPLMWAHYSDKHKGACLIFENSISPKFLNIPDDRITESKVTYEPFSVFNFIENKKKGILKLFATKSRDWKYEKEYRYILLENEGLMKFNPSFLTGIIFGMNVNDKTIETFCKNCEREKVKLKYKRAVKETSGLKIIDIN